MNRNGRARLRRALICLGADERRHGHGGHDGWRRGPTTSGRLGDRHRGLVVARPPRGDQGSTESRPTVGRGGARTNVRGYGGKVHGWRVVLTVSRVLQTLILYFCGFFHLDIVCSRTL